MPKTPIHKKARLEYLGKIILLTLLYYAAGKISFNLSFAMDNLILLWLPAGIALAALLLYGTSLWPGVFFGSLLANTTLPALPHTVVAVSAGNTLACLSSTYILQKWLRFDPGLQRVQDALALLLAGGIWNPLVSAAFGAMSLSIASQFSFSLFFHTWWVWTINDSVSILLLTPLILAWSAAHRETWKRSLVLEGSVLFLLLAAVSRAVYGGWLNLDMSAPLSFVLLPFISWAALRLGKLGATTMTLFGSGFAMWGTIRGHGPFIVADDHTNFLYLSGFIMTAAMTALLITAMVNERSRAQKEQARIEARYRDMINNAPIGIARATPQGNILDCNPALVSMLRYPNKESLLAANAVSTFLTLQERQQKLSAMDDGKTRFSDEVLFKRYDGTPIWANLSATAIKNPDDGSVYYEIAVQDITRRKEAEEELKQRWDENIRLMLTLEKKVQDRTQQLSTLYRIAKLATHEQQIERFFESTLEILLEALQSPFGAIVLCQQYQETPSLTAVKGTLPEPMPADKILSKASPWLQLLERETILVVERPHMEAFIPADLNSPVQYGFLGAPIRHNRRTIGSLGALYNTNASEYRQEHIVLLETVCDHLGTAIESARLRQQAELAVIAEERQRLARELHDSVTQSIYSATLMADAAQQLSACGKTKRAKHFLDELCETTRHALKEMRLLIYELRPSLLEQLGLEQALRQRLEMVERHAGIEGKLFYRQPLPLAPAIEEGLFRIAQEALNNVIRHSNASAVSLRMIGKDSCVTLEITDNGNGFDSAKMQPQSGLGLTNMRERAKKNRGNFRNYIQAGQWNQS